MNILEINRETLYRLYNQFSNSFEGLSLDGSYLVYNNERVDISNFNINDLLSSETRFTASLDLLGPEDIFKIIRLHATFLNNPLTNKNKMNNAEDEVEIIKQSNPLMKNISIIKKNEEGFEKEYINIVDSNGIDHIFRNDRDVNVFYLYEMLNAYKAGGEVTPDELIREVSRKLPEVNLTSANLLMENSIVSEDFINKVKRVNEQFKDDKTIQVLGNEVHDMVVIRDLTDSTNHRVVTFEKNEYGQLVSQEHGQNVLGTDTITRDGNNTQIDTATGVNETSETEKEVIDNTNEEVVATLISTQEFYDLLNSPKELNEAERKNIDLYYAYLGDLILYEDYLLSELKQILMQFRNYVLELQYSVEEESVDKNLTEKQQEAVKKSEEMELKAASIDQEVLEKQNVEDKVKVLRKTMPDNHNAGSVSVLQVLAVIIGVSIILTAVTLYLIG